VGTSHARNTYLHAVDEMMKLPNRITDTPTEVKIRRASGEVLTRRINTHHSTLTPDISARFPKYEPHSATTAPSRTAALAMRLCRPATRAS